MGMRMQVQMQPKQRKEKPFFFHFLPKCIEIFEYSQFIYYGVVSRVFVHNSYNVRPIYSFPFPFSKIKTLETVQIICIWSDSFFSPVLQQIERESSLSRILRRST